MTERVMHTGPPPQNSPLTAFFQGQHDHLGRSSFSRLPCAALQEAVSNSPELKLLYTGPSLAQLRKLNIPDDGTGLGVQEEITLLL